MFMIPIDPKHLVKGGLQSSNDGVRQTWTLTDPEAGDWNWNAYSLLPISSFYDDPQMRATHRVPIRIAFEGAAVDFWSNNGAVGLEIPYEALDGLIAGLTKLRDSIPQTVEESYLQMEQWRARIQQGISEPDCMASIEDAFADKPR